MRKGNLEKFIAKANEIHNNRYDYSLVLKNEPNSVKDKITIICPKHGKFDTTFDSHVHGKNGCPICSGHKKLTQEEFIKKCEAANGIGRYDYSKTEYVNSATKVLVICHEKNILGEEHGEFWVRASHLMDGHGCPKCHNRYPTTEESIAAARKIHGDKYDYSLIEYHGDSREKLPIICHEVDEYGNEHGIFTPSWSSHLSGVGALNVRVGWHMIRKYS